MMNKTILKVVLQMVLKSRLIISVNGMMNKKRKMSYLSKLMKVAASIKTRCKFCKDKCYNRGRDMEFYTISRQTGMGCRALFKEWSCFYWK